MTDDDTLIVVLFQRYAVTSIQVLEWATRLGANVVAVTDRASRILLRGVTHVLTVSTDTPMLFPGMAAAIAVLEVLTSGVAAAIPEAATRLLAAQEQMAAENGIYYRRPAKGQRLTNCYQSSMTGD